MVMGAQRARTLPRPESTPHEASRPEVSPAETGAQACADRLDQLGPALTACGMTASLVTPAGRVPSLRVVNPAAPALAEDVYAGCCEDGSWWFWWSWAERIAAASDLDQAAARIAHVLAAPHEG